MSAASRTGSLGIIGAGIGGLVAAIALQRRGHRVTLYEQAPALGEIGAGLTLSPNACHALFAIGLEEKIRAAATLPMNQFLHHYQSGKILLTIPRHDTEKKYGAPYLFIHRADLHAILVEAVRAHDEKALRTGCTVTGIEEGEGGLRPVFTDGFGDTHDAMIGADGLRSAVRRQLFGEVEQRFTGHVAYRFLVPKAARPFPVPPDESHNHAGPERIFVYYPIRHGDFINCVGLARSGAWSEEGWSIPATQDEVAEVFAGWNEQVSALIGAMRDGACFKWGLFARAPLRAYVKGKVALIGDAAHPMLPFLGMGAATAIEDGLVLARAIEAAGGEVEEGFWRYEAARVTRGNLIQEESTNGADRLQVPDPEIFRNSPPRLEETLGLLDYNPASVPV